jgi:hypothetical protein
MVREAGEKQRVVEVKESWRVDRQDPVSPERTWMWTDGNEQLSKKDSL